MASTYKLPYMNYGAPASGATNFGGVSDQSNPFLSLSAGGPASVANPAANPIADAASSLAGSVGLQPALGGGTGPGGSFQTPNVDANGVPLPSTDPGFGFTNIGATFGNAETPQLSASGTPLPGSRAAMQAAVNANESTADFWKTLEEANPTTFASVIETAYRGAGIPIGGISTTGPNISGSSPQRLAGADFGAGALFGEGGTPSAMLDPALEEFVAQFGHNPWDTDPSTGQQYALPGSP